MPLLKVLRFPDERLRTVAKPVTDFGEVLQTQIDNMLETMYEEKGIGLAATQVDFHQQLIVMDLQDEVERPTIFINPEIVSKSGEFTNEEGCLSVPGIYAKVDRAEFVTLKAQDRHGKEFTVEADELFAICLQHEMDHLKGKLFVDYLSKMKRDRIKTKLEKEARLEAKEA
ncbi:MULTISPECIES: peptide deformylase [unclassified Shewanella]|uniref:peptide deformylase n=1 Tax=unclassified Shewanella TaxID=196818 RepID=UPI000CB97A2C|nr:MULTISPECIES: peptide deformylase [unclassified Shewanella]MDO6619109.1 peptide deformylase [Shewanella sp. 6_MG-2023]MDO6640939.1 peptide deformylase [Shewanella sp. 5_MG-2023]MDO6776065.1 peptide deformylase [Shewanella sp. 3_MG-2023]PMG30893.1 peptide deformylase [Shewanella sp. 10N.286.52.C2]PMG51849.1 peptide deformylase [Shewanella sp. 10N.286.52.B9]